MKYLATFSYDGSKYYGYQKQKKQKSIQEEIENKLSQINSNKEVTIYASGRTDAGVHANNQKAHFILDDNIEVNRLKHSLNNMLSSYIYIKDIEKVDNEFHARFSAKKKKYIYKINLGEYNPIMHDYIYQYCKKLNIEDMIKASKYLIGVHDFKSFTKANDLKDNYNREIFDINIINEEYLTIEFIGNGFMRYMVRNLVGSLIEVGEGNKKPNDIVKILNEKNRISAGKTAPAVGLYLDNVYYD